VAPPEIAPWIGTLQPLITPVLLPTPQETRLPILVPTGAPLTGSVSLFSSDTQPLGYPQIITRLLDHSIRQIKLILNPGAEHDSEKPPEYRILLAPDAR
jgi:hypothetical protein